VLLVTPVKTLIKARIKTSHLYSILTVPPAESLVAIKIKSYPLNLVAEIATEVGFGQAG
jgi:hypothetical protein